MGVAAEAEVGGDGGGGAGEEDDALEPVGDFAGSGADAAPVVGALLEEVAVLGRLAPHVVFDLKLQSSSLPPSAITDYSFPTVYAPERVRCPS